MASFGRCRSGLRWPLGSWPAALSQTGDQCPLLGTTERSSTDQLWASADRPLLGVEFTNRECRIVVESRRSLRGQRRKHRPALRHHHE